MILEVLGALTLAAVVFWLVFPPRSGSTAPGLALLEPEAPELEVLKLEVLYEEEAGHSDNQRYHSNRIYCC